MIEGHVPIRDAYRDETVARNYFRNRFSEPLGALLHHRQASALASTIASLRPARALEVAPGPARLSLEVLRHLSGELILLDASRQMLEEAESRLRAADRGRWACIQGDAFSLPFGAADFDLVYSFRLIRHFEMNDRLRVYEQVHRVLRPDGTFVFDAVNEAVSAPLRRADPASHVHFDALLDRDRLTSELSTAGFAVHSFTGVQHRYSWLHRTQVLVAPRSRVLAGMLMTLIDTTGGEPLEWIVTCRRV